MAVDDDLLERAVEAIAGVALMEMDPEALADDVVLVAYLWSDDDEFKMAIASVRRAISQLVEGKVSGVELKYDHFGWLSYHFQHRRAQGERADMRVVYRLTEGGIRVRGFGHRKLPSDIYLRLHKER